MIETTPITLCVEDKAPAALGSGFVKDLDPNWFDYAHRTTQSMVSSAAACNFVNICTKKPGSSVWPKGIPADFS